MPSDLDRVIVCGLVSVWKKEMVQKEMVVT